MRSVFPYSSKSMLIVKKTLHTCDYGNKLTEEDLTVCFVAHLACSSILSSRISEQKGLFLLYMMRLIRHALKQQEIPVGIKMTM